MTSKILITGVLHSRGLEILHGAEDVTVDYRPDLPYPEILRCIGEYHALLTRSETDVTREMIDAGQRLKVIARAAVGFANIDVDYATEKGILVINTPGKNTNSAAELTFGLLLAAVRNVIPAHAHLQNQEWDRHRFAGTELMGKTLGIIGLGNVGHRVARFARAFDMEVLAYDPYISDEAFEVNHAHKVDLDALIARSDVISLHTPKTPETVGLIDAARIACMKDGVILLNLARGGLIDEAALAEALKSGKVAGAGIDTWDQEPVRDNPFRGMPQVVMTPHIGASTREAQLRIAESIAEQVLRALREGVVDFPVNMPRLKVLATPRVKFYTVLAEKLGRFAVQSLDFNPRLVRILYRGELTAEEGSLVRRAFLKGFLAGTSDDAVTFVNAERLAEARQIHVIDEEDPGFKDYPSAVKFTVSDHEQEFTIGGVVFGEDNYRLSLVNGFAFEVVPDGHMLTMVNVDQPGVIGKLGTILGDHGVNISQFELSRNRPGGEAMSVIRVDEPVDRAVLESLRSLPYVLSLHHIVI